MKITLYNLDRIILFLLSFIVLVDMVNGFFLMEYRKLPISQVYKLLLLFLFTLRLSKSKDFFFIVLIFFIYQLGPIFGFIKTGDISSFYRDAVVSMKWFNVPLSFFYFKNLFQSDHVQTLIAKLVKMISRSLKLISLNLFLGMLGFGMAFYNHGYGNAVGTRGYIFAGNELTVLVLALGFVLAIYYYNKKEFKKYLLSFLGLLIISFLLTSKTIIAGVLIVFVIPLISSIKVRIKRKWLDVIVSGLVFGIPFLIIAFYIGITQSGYMDKLNFSLKRNNYDLMTVILSNRNNFIKDGWEAYTEKFSILGKIFGYGQQYHLNLSGHLAEVDFFSLLFASGLLGLLTLFFIISYWIVNAIKLSKTADYIYAKQVLIYLVFLVVVANLAGHIFGSGIAGFFLGFSLALMFYKQNSLTNA